MPDTAWYLTEPLLQETVDSVVCCSKRFALLFLILGLGVSVAVPWASPGPTIVLAAVPEPVSPVAVRHAAASSRLACRIVPRWCAVRAGHGARIAARLELPELPRKLPELPQIRSAPGLGAIGEKLEQLLPKNPADLFPRSLADLSPQSLATPDTSFADAADGDLAKLPAPGRVVAVGDLHGDLVAFLRVLKLADLYDAKRGGWIGGNAVLVQVGDVLDRGDDELELLQLLRRLKVEAAACGGAVVTLLGNHEVLSALGVMTYVSNASAAKFKDRQTAFVPGGKLAAELATWPVACVVGDTAFCHGGLTKSQIESGLTMGNVAASSWLRGHEHSVPSRYNRLKPLLPPEVLWTHSKTAPKSPIWTRALSYPPLGTPSQEACQDLQDALAQIGAKRLVVGHTPQPYINSACGGLVYRIDVGLSKAIIGNRPQALQISETGRVDVLTEGEMPAPVSEGDRGSAGYVVQKLVRQIGDLVDDSFSLDLFSLGQRRE